MAVFQYIAKPAGAGGGGGAGGAVQGTITADTPRQARDELRQRGLSVRDLAEQKPTHDRRIVQRYLARRQAGKVTELLQEMSTLLAAGIPLLQALDTLTRQHEGRFQRSILLIRDQVAGGGSLTDAMKQQPELFDELCINIVEVGENAGTLDSSLARLVEFRRRSGNLKNKVANALIYPCIVLAVGIAVSIFLMTYVVPNLLSVLLDSGKELPFATVVVKAVSDFLLHDWWILVIAVAGVTLGWSAVMKSEAGRRRFHRLQLRLPVLGELIRKQSIARVSLVMSTLLKSDLTFVHAVKIAQRTVKNLVLRDALVECEKAVYAGRDISDALEKTDAFPPLVVQVFAVGQASGRLETMLENLATDYDAQVDVVSSRLTAMLEPIMMILLAVAVGFIAFATILPVMQAGDVL
ncbi:MAG: type II secretion system F family protein [Phycisphaeraceae bacterium]